MRSASESTSSSDFAGLTTTPLLSPSTMRYPIPTPPRRRPPPPTVPNGGGPPTPPTPSDRGRLPEPPVVARRPHVQLGALRREQLVEHRGEVAVLGDLRDEQ